MRLLALATLLVVRVMPFYEEQMQSIEMSDLALSSCLFIILTYTSTDYNRRFLLSSDIATNTYFLEGPIVVMLVFWEHFGTKTSKAVLCISSILYDGSARKAFLIFKMFSMLIFIAWAKVFLALACFDFARITVLSHSGMDGGILKIFFLCG